MKNALQVPQKLRAAQEHNDALEGLLAQWWLWADRAQYTHAVHKDISWSTLEELKQQTLDTLSPERVECVLEDVAEAMADAASY